MRHPKDAPVITGSASGMEPGAAIVNAAAIPAVICAFASIMLYIPPKKNVTANTVNIIATCLITSFVLTIVFTSCRKIALSVPDGHILQRYLGQKTPFKHQK